MPGVALFRSPYGASQFGYREIKEGKLKYEQHRDDTIGDLDALITDFVSIDRQDGAEVGGSLTQKIEDFEQFVADMRERFGIPNSEEQSQEINGISYSKSPYDRQVIHDSRSMQPAGFSMALDPQEKEDVLDEAAKILAPLPNGKRSKSMSKRSRGFGGGNDS
jgi:hypothetical protein